MNKTLIHPGLMNKLSGFFPLTCIIQSLPDPEATDEYGEPDSKFTNKYVDISARLSEMGRGKDEVKRKDGTFVFSAFIIILSGIYEIDAKDQAIIDEKIYDILSINYDSEQQMTRLITEIVK